MLVPANTPHTEPVPPPTVTLLLLAVHAPPAGVAVSVVQLPTHTLVAPAITPGSALTVTIKLREHPVVAVYTIVYVPAVPELKAPVLEIVAGAPTDHVPPAGEEE